MYGLDTNILVRYLVQDDPEQSKLATQFIETRCTDEQPCHINHIVLCELCWVLESNYQLVRDDISNVIEQLLQVEQLDVIGIDSVWRALNDYKNSNADFSDHLIARIHQYNGCRTTMTFDKKAAHQTGFTLLRKKR